MSFRVRDALGTEATASFNIQVLAAADLVMSRLDVPSSGLTDAPFAVAYRESSGGSKPASGVWSQRLWLSTDAALDPGPA